MNLIAFSGPRNCVNMQYAALSGAMVWYEKHQLKQTIADPDELPQKACIDPEGGRVQTSPEKSQKI